MRYTTNNNRVCAPTDASPDTQMSFNSATEVFGSTLTLLREREKNIERVRESYERGKEL